MHVTRWLLVLTLCGLGASGCGASESDSASSSPRVAEAAEAPAEAPAEPTPECALEGRWRMTRYPGMDDVGPNGERPMGMSREYRFGDGRFHMEGYPALTIDGRYRVASVDGRTITVEMSEVVFDGEPSGDESHEVTFAEGCDEMEMERFTYARTG